MKKDLTIYQFILQDLQETSYPRFTMSTLHYRNKKEAKSIINSFGPEFKVIRAYLPSKLTGWIAEKVYNIENGDK
jgi:hypothetical protein